MSTNRALVRGGARAFCVRGPEGVCEDFSPARLALSTADGSSQSTGRWCPAIFARPGRRSWPDALAEEGRPRGWPAECFLGASGFIRIVFLERMPESTRERELRVLNAAFFRPRLCRKRETWVGRRGFAQVGRKDQTAWHEQVSRRGGVEVCSLEAFAAASWRIGSHAKERQSSASAP